MRPNQNGLSPSRTSRIPVRAFVAATIAIGILAIGVDLRAQQANSAVSSFSVTVLDATLDSGSVQESERIVTVNLRDCRELLDSDARFRFNWTLSSSMPSGSTFSVKRTEPDGECDETSTSDDNDGCELIVGPDSSDSVRSVEAEIDAIELFTFSSPDACEGISEDLDILLVFPQTATTGTDEITFEADQTVVRLRTIRPDRPTSLSANAGGSQIEVSWEEPDDDISDYRVYYAESDVFDGLLIPEALDDVAGVSTKTTTGARSSTDLTDGIDEGNDYWIAVTARDASGNESQFSNVVTTSTVPVQDFWEAYLAAGGQEAGGYCAVAPTGTSPRLPLGAALVGLALIVARGRRRRCAVVSRLAAPLLALASFVGVGLAVPAVAHAGPVESPITGMVELRLGRYIPEIDDEFDGSAGLYETIFNDDARLFVELEYSHQFYQGIGSLGVGFNVGRFAAKGNSRTLDGERAPDETRLDIVPLRVAAVYRFDYLQRRYNVPFVLAAKLGLDYYLWWVRSGDGVADAPDGDGGTVVGRGGTTGYHIEGGIYFLLDVLAPHMARTFDGNIGVNNTYLFAELLAARVDDFGSDDSWDLSDTSMLFGIGFEF